jgi:general secretion pathway protein A
MSSAAADLLRDAQSLGWRGGVQSHPGALSMYPKPLRREESPFSAAPSPRYLYMSDKHREALAHLLYGVSAAGGFVLLTGEVGTGKTTLCRCLVDQLPENVDLALCFHSKLSEIELLEHICDELSVDYPSCPSLKCLVSCLNQHLLESHARGRTTVFLIDEAQNLGRDVLEQVRLLTNLETERAKLLQIILVGQPELDEVLSSRELRQLAQRITARYHLRALGADETSNLIRHRLLVGGLSPALFTGSALREVYRRSGGIPRLINVICDRALLAAYAQDKHRIDRRLVRTASAEILPGFRARITKPARSTSIGVALGFAGAMLSLLTLDAALEWPLASHLGRSSLATGAVDEFPLARSVAEALAMKAPVAAAAGSADEGVGLSSDRSYMPASSGAGNPVHPALAEPSSSASRSPSATRPTGSVTEEYSSVAAVVEPNLEATGHSSKGVARSSQRSENSSAAEPLSFQELLRRAGVFARVEEALAPPGPGPAQAAIEELLELWSVDYRGAKGDDACAKATSAGLECFAGHGSWGTLEAINRPALIWLTTPQGYRVEALLITLTNSQAHLHLDGTTVVADLAELTSRWTGEFLVLWKRPAGITRTLSIGMSGRDVAWLRDSLRQMRGEDPARSSWASFDDGLRNKVMAFQRSVGLVEDGIAGPATTAYLASTASKITGPVLSSGN